MRLVFTLVHPHTTSPSLKHESQSQAAHKPAALCHPGAPRHRQPGGAVTHYTTAGTAQGNQPEVSDQNCGVSVGKVYHMAPSQRSNHAFKHSGCLPLQIIVPLHIET